MKSLIFMNYKQPKTGKKFRWGVLESIRNTEKKSRKPTKQLSLVGIGENFFPFQKLGYGQN